MAKSTSHTPATYYSEHQRKKIIRSQWCKPQINLLYTHLKKRLIYIGLPDLKALDVLDWIDYLDKVIAFQCTEYKGKAINVQELEDLLVDLERKNLIKSSIVYHGWMEEIVMGGLSKIGQTYSQTEFLKIYNLDFCNNFNTPTTVRNERGRTIEIIYKSQAIDRLLDFQKKQNGSKFLMYLTVNSDTFDEDLSKVKEPFFKDYIKRIKQVTKPEVLAVRRMKAFCFNEIRNIFLNHDFHVEFLPPIFYLGSEYPNRAKGGKIENHRMMTFTILGTKRKDGEELYRQNEEEFLNRQFIFASDKAITCYIDRYIEEQTYDPNVENLILNSYTYKNLW